MTEIEEFVNRLMEESGFYDVNYYVTKYNLKRSNKIEVRYIRYYLIYLMYHKTKMTLKEIGSHFNKRHSTIIHNVREVDNLLETKDPIFLDIKSRHHKEFNKIKF